MALEALQGTPGLERIVTLFYKYGYERVLRIRYTGSNIKVNEHNIPEVYALFKEAGRILDLRLNARTIY